MTALIQRQQNMVMGMNLVEDFCIRTYHLMNHLLSDAVIIYPYHFGKQPSTQKGAHAWASCASRTARSETSSLQGRMEA